eukprot:TRINITY_DN12036_c0_g1_i2.p1 TRINITY_DN12036_c0_g1~~TRINITY_DN12036_c0_g1_i2.p1  ORF type:complete len:205 (-),score=62.82 TRINITY_DN12036_c0_g1_i2:133-747(-)
MEKEVKPSFSFTHAEPYENEIVESPLNRFVREKGGTPKASAITKEDYKQALRDICEWFKTYCKAYYDRLKAIKPITETDLEKVQFSFARPLPLAIRTLLEMHNGGFQLLDTFVTLPLSHIEASVKSLRTKKGWKEEYVPVAKDAEGQYLCVETAGENEVRLVVWNEDGIEAVSKSFGKYIESIRDSMLLKKLEYDEIVGLISIV